jgi:hypothetical protein
MWAYESKKTEVGIGIFEKINTSHFFEQSAVKVSEVVFNEPILIRVKELESKIIHRCFVPTTGGGGRKPIDVHPTHNANKLSLHKGMQ